MIYSEYSKHFSGYSDMNCELSSFMKPVFQKQLLPNDLHDDGMLIDVKEIHSQNASLQILVTVDGSSM